MEQLDDALESRWATVQGLEMHYRTIETSSCTDLAIVMVHGLGVSSTYMLPTARLLADHYPVYLPELPGTGKSEKPRKVLSLTKQADILVNWMMDCGLQRVVLLGNSLGCQIIVRCAIRHRSLVAGLILTAPTMDREARSLPRISWRVLRDMPFEPPSLYPIVLADYLKMGVRRALKTLHMSRKDNIEAYLSRVTVPTLVVRGEHDSVAPQRWAEQVTKLLPQGHLITVENAAHGINYDAPEALSHITRQFVEEIRISQPAPVRATFKMHLAARLKFPPVHQLKTRVQHD